MASHDGNGNLVGLMSATNGTSTAQYEYGPFGEVIRASGVMAMANPIRFSTKVQDDESGLLYYGFRYYNPSLGFWLARDPSEELGGQNLYGFVYNSPLETVDLLGLWLLYDALKGGSFSADLSVRGLLGLLSTGTGANKLPHADEVSDFLGEAIDPVHFRIKKGSISTNQKTDCNCVYLKIDVAGDLNFVKTLLKKAAKKVLKNLDLPGSGFLDHLNLDARVIGDGIRFMDCKGYTAGEVQKSGHITLDAFVGLNYDPIKIPKTGTGGGISLLMKIGDPYAIEIGGSAQIGARVSGELTAGTKVYAGPRTQVRNILEWSLKGKVQFYPTVEFQR